jgi:AcrR family transcriptional regulator
MTDSPRDSFDRAEPAPISSGGRRDRRGSTRAALLAAAERLWAERGIRGASLEDIAAAAGLTKGAVYSNFAGKADMLFALLERYAEYEMKRTVGWVFRDSERPLDARLMQEYERRMGTAEARLRALLMVEFWLYGMRDDAVGQRVADWYELRRNRLAERLTGREPTGTERTSTEPTGEEPTEEPTEESTGAEDISALDRATLVIAMDTGLMIQHLIDPDQVSARLYASGIRLVLAGSSQER